MTAYTTTSHPASTAPPLHNIGRTIKTDNHPIAVVLKDKDMEQEKKQVTLPAELQGKKFRIRKLTPRECFRLMGVSDADIDKIQASGISNSSQYKLAGNSIVAGGNYVDCHNNVDGVLYNIFRKMFIDTEPDYEQGTQLTLF